MKYLTMAMIGLIAGQVTAADLSMKFKLNHSDGIYRTGEKIVVTAQLLADGKPIKDAQLQYLVAHDGNNVVNTTKPGDKPVTVETSMDKPGWCRFTFMGKNQNGKLIDGMIDGKKRQAYFEIGVMVDPLKLKQGVPTPNDFVAYWDKQKAELDKLPFNAKLTPIPGAPDYKKEHFVKLDCGKVFRPVDAVLHVPANAKPKSLPIHLFVHGAGIHQPKHHWQAPGRGAAKGQKIFMNLNAHGIPNDKPASYYKEMSEGELKNYPFQNSTEREKYYMKGMILRVYRALQYLKTLPEWNGKDIVVTGGSQGGAQCLFAAGLDPQVTEIHADVPAMCDLGGPMAGRVAGWPKLYFKKGDTIMINSDYNWRHAKPGSPSIVQTAGYFDGVNFAKQIKCLVRITTGGNDGVCPPSSVFAAYNSMPTTDKTIAFSPLGGHCRGIYKDGPNIKLAHFKNAAKEKTGE